MTPSHAVKKGVRYRYYVSRILVTGGHNKESGQRIPATHIKSLVTGRIRAWLADPVAVLNALQCCGVDVAAQKRLLGEAAQVAASLVEVDAEQLRAILRAVVTKVQVRPDRVDLTFNQMGVAFWLNAKDQPQPVHAAGDDRERCLTVLTMPVRLKRAGMRGLDWWSMGWIESANVDPGLVRLLLSAHGVHARLLEEPSLTLQEIAAEEGISSSYATRLLRLAFLTPDIVTAILNGRHPPQLTANRLMDNTRLPLDWSAQRELLYS